MEYLGYIFPSPWYASVVCFHLPPTVTLLLSIVLLASVRVAENPDKTSGKTKIKLRRDFRSDLQCARVEGAVITMCEWERAHQWFSRRSQRKQPEISASSHQPV